MPGCNHLRQVSRSGDPRPTILVSTTILDSAASRPRRDTANNRLHPTTVNRTTVDRHRQGPAIHSLATARSRGADTVRPP
jgi:hypothetical protein